MQVMLTYLKRNETRREASFYIWVNHCLHAAVALRRLLTTFRDVSESGESLPVEGKRKDHSNSLIEKIICSQFQPTSMHS